MLVSLDNLAQLDEVLLGGIYRTSRRLLRAGETDSIYTALLDGLIENLGCAGAAFYQPGPDATGLGLLRTAGAIGDRWPTWLEADHQWLRGVGEARDADGPSVASAWVASEARLYGLLVATWPEGQLRAVERGMAVSMLAEDAAQALTRFAGPPKPNTGAWESEKLFVTLRRVIDLGLLAGGLLDRQLPNILGEILDRLECGGAGLFLYDEPHDQLELALTVQAATRRLDQPKACLWHKPYLAQALAQAMATLAKDIALQRGLNKTDPNTAAALQATLTRLGVGELVNLPLTIEGRTEGVLQVTVPAGQVFEAHQVQVLKLVAHQLAASLAGTQTFAQIRADHDRARAVIEASNDALLMLDEHSRTVIINRRARFFFGLSERDLVGKRFDQLGLLFSQAFDDGQPFNLWLGHLLASPHERALREFNLLRPERRLLQCFSAPVLDRQERYLGRMLVFRDITREREVERMKNDFVSIVSHELRTPLTSMHGALQLLLGKPGGRPGVGAGLTEQAHQLLSVSLSNTERLVRLVNDILDIARMEQGGIKLRRERIAPDELCRVATIELGGFARTRTVSLDLNLGSGLPAVLADRDRALQILINLLSNAVKFSRPGQRVLLSAQRDEQMVCFTVRDWGRGIADEHQLRIFEKFQQIDSSATRDTGGTGLGLAISKALVEEHGGHMWLESTLGVGSSFSFTLPIVPEAVQLDPEQD